MGWHIGYDYASYRIYEAHKSIVGRCSVAVLKADYCIVVAVDITIMSSDRNVFGLLVIIDLVFKSIDCLIKPLYRLREVSELIGNLLKLYGGSVVYLLELLLHFPRRFSKV